MIYLDGTVTYDLKRLRSTVYKEPDHSMVSRGGYDFDPESRQLPGELLREGIENRCYGKEARGAQWN
jgi:hypothetical protein